MAEETTEKHLAQVKPSFMDFMKRLQQRMVAEQIQGEDIDGLFNKGYALGMTMAEELQGLSEEHKLTFMEGFDRGVEVGSIRSMQ